MKNTNTIPAVEKTLKILEYLSGRKNGAGTAELASVCGASATTGYRILQTLQKFGWVRRCSNGSFALVHRENELEKLREKSQRILEALSAESRLASKLSVRQWEEQVTIARAEAPGPFSLNGKTGAKFPVIEGSVGAVLLADETEEEILSLCKRCPVPIPEKENPEIILERIAHIRKTGSVCNEGASRWKISALSVPVRTSDGRIAAALTLLGMKDDFTERECRRLTGLLKKYAENFYMQENRNED